MRVASLVYAATLCCMPCAMLIVDNHGAWAVWMFVIVVRTVSDAAMLAAMCCSYILITLCVSQKRLLSANTLAQGATALLYSTVPLGVNKVVTLAELPCNYNSATYYLLFVIGAVASLLALFGTFFTSGVELDKCKNKGKQGRIEQIEMQPVK